MSTLFTIHSSENLFSPAISAQINYPRSLSEANGKYRTQPLLRFGIQTTIFSCFLPPRSVIYRARLRLRRSRWRAGNFASTYWLKKDFLSVRLALPACSEECLGGIRSLVSDPSTSGEEFGCREVKAGVPRWKGRTAGSEE